MSGARKNLRPLNKSEQMARVRSCNTKPEETLRKALWARGARYRIHARLPGTPDLAFPGVRVAVFVDGCFWHGCPEHYSRPVTNRSFWVAKLDRNLARDRKVDEALRSLGWRVVRIWEHEIRDDIERTVDLVMELLASPPQHQGGEDAEP